MRNNNLLFGLFGLMFIMMLGFASAVGTATLVLPAQGGNYTTTMAVNVSTDMVNPLNASFFYNASGGAVDLTSALVVVQNNTASDIDFYQASVTISSLTDAATYNFSARVDNGTDLAWGSNNAITIDSTNPTCTSSRSGKSVPKQFDSISLSCDCTDAIDTSVTHTRTLTKPSGSLVTLTSSPETVAVADLSQAGQYTFSCSAIDNPGNTGTADFTFIVSSSGEGGVILGEIERQSGGNTGFFLIMGLGIVGVIVVIAVTMMTTKKRKRR